MGLSKRERVLIGIGIAALAGAGYWSLIHAPLEGRRSALLAERDLLAAVEDRLDRLEATADLAEAAPTEPLLDRIVQRAEAQVVPLVQIVPDGLQVQVSTGEMAFADLLGWLSDLSNEDRVTASAASITRQTEPGQVTARLTLGDF